MGGWTSWTAKGKQTPICVQYVKIAKKKKEKKKKAERQNASWSWRIREAWCWVGETMLQQECHLSHPWHDALHHCVPWSDSLFVQTSGSIKNDPQPSQRPSIRSKRQTEVKRQTIFQYRCLIFTACSIAGVDGRPTVRREDRVCLSGRMAPTVTKTCSSNF